MPGEGKIVDGSGVEVSAWEPENRLRQLSPEEARFSRGFLCADPSTWFSSLAGQWVPLFHWLEAEVHITSYELGFGFPTDIPRTRTVEFNSEPGVLGMDQFAVDAIGRTIVPEIAGVAEDVVLEYIERRILSSLSKSWSADEPLQCYYLSGKDPKEVDVLGRVTVHVQIGGVPCLFWFGLGPRMVERVDSSWRKELFNQQRAQGQDVLSDQLHAVSIELAELAVPPAMLIDYMRSGTLIDLEVPVGKPVVARLDEVSWVSGELCHFHGSLALAVTESSVVQKNLPEGTTRVRVEIARAELDHEGIVEHQQKGAVLLTRVPINTTASLLISGENVASAIIHELDGSYALSVLAK